MDPGKTEEAQKNTGINTGRKFANTFTLNGLGRGVNLPWAVNA